MIVLLIALTWVILEGILALTHSSMEAGVAIREIVFFATWSVIVTLSFTGVAQHNSYRIFRTNERRWVALAALTAVFFVWCSITGWGQPMLQGIEDGLANKYSQIKSSETAKSVESKLIVGVNFFLRRWDIDEYVPEEKKPSTSADRPFYGVVTWSHWIVFVSVYLPALFLYGLAARREEVLAWVERRRQGREERDRRRGPEAGPVGTSEATPHRPGWWLAMEGIIDAMAGVVGNIISARWFRV